MHWQIFFSQGHLLEFSDTVTHLGRVLHCSQANLEALKKLPHSDWPVADPEGVPWVPWNPSFEGLPSKILCANVLLCSHWSYALQLHCIQQKRTCVSSIISFINKLFVAHGLRARIMSKASERIKSKSCVAPSANTGRMAIYYPYESAYFPGPYADNQLLCSLCGPKRHGKHKNRFQQ